MSSCRSPNDPTATSESASRIRRFALLACAVAIVILLLRGAWLSDDAYISFRCSLNLARGHGLRWNPDERVQAFTNPLWTLLVALPLTFTSDVYAVAIIAHLALTLLALVLLFRLAPREEVALVAFLALVLSKSFVDYCTSGLENSLSHVLMLAFVLAALTPAEPLVRMRRVALLAGVVLVDRLDLSLLVGPALAYETLHALRALGGTPRASRRVARELLLGLAPWLAWELLALVYFGFALPNTYYAKECAGWATGLMVAHGVLYLYNSLLLDPATLATIAVATVVALAQREARPRALATGVLLYLVFVVRSGGDFMSGRFLSVPLVTSVGVLAVLLGAYEPRGRVFALGAWAAVVLFASDVARFPTLTADYQAHADVKDRNGISDEQREAWGGMGLSGIGVHRAVPTHEWIHVGNDIRKHPAKVEVLGGIGLAGYYAGDVGHIVDEYGLSDPLLARLPIPDAAHERRGRAGHMRRRVPDGYVETLESGHDAFRSPDVAQYYDALRLVTSGPVFGWARLRTLVAMNLGRYDSLIAAYRPEYDHKIIRPADLDHGADEDLPDGVYSYWHPCATPGVAFTSTGAELVLDRAVRRAKLQLSPGTYDITTRFGAEIVGTVHTGGGEVELLAPREFQTVVIDVSATGATHPAGTWTLEAVHGV